MLSMTVSIVNLRGLHARAAAKFVKKAAAYDADIVVQYQDMTVPATSIMGLMMLGAGKGCQILLQAEGAQAEEALQALAELIANKFDEEV